MSTLPLSVIALDVAAFEAMLHLVTLLLKSLRVRTFDRSLLIGFRMRLRRSRGRRDSAASQDCRGFIIYSGLWFPRPNTLDGKPDWALHPGLGTLCNTWLG